MKHVLCLSLAVLMLILPVASMTWAQALPNDEPRPSSIKKTDPLDSLRALAKSGDTYAVGYIDGNQSAKRLHDADGWAWGGFFGGLCLGLIGTVAVTAMSSGGSAQPPASTLLRMDDRPTEYRIGFLEGYHKVAKSENLSNALWGGLGGTATLVVIYMLAVQTRK